MSTRQVIHLAAFATLLFRGANVFAAMVYTFSFDPPSGNIQGTSGSTIGWGYSIMNGDLTDWLVTVNLTSDSFTDATPDASVFDFPIIAPGATAALPYDGVSGTGLFALTWAPLAPIGFTNSGMFTLDAEWWTGDPFAGGTRITTATSQTAAYSASVSSPVSAVPEPRGLWLSAPLVVVMFFLRKRAGLAAAAGNV